MTKVNDIVKRTKNRNVCSGCDRELTGPHACPGGAKIDYNIVLISIPPEKKMAVIKTIRGIVSFEMSLSEIQKFVESVLYIPAHPQRKAAPGIPFKRDVLKEEACNIAQLLETAGAIVELC